MNNRGPGKFTRNVLLLAWTCLCVPEPAAGWDLGGMDGLPRTAAERRIRSVSDGFSGLSAAGFFQTGAARLWSVGLTVAFVDPVGARAVPAVFAFGSVRAPLIGAGFFVRTGWVPLRALRLGGADAAMFGFGAGWDRTLGRILNLRFAGHAQVCGMKRYSSVSIGPAITASWVRSRNLRPFLTAGFDATRYRLDGAVSRREGWMFSFKLGLGISWSRRISADAAIFPVPAVSLSAAAGR